MRWKKARKSRYLIGRRRGGSSRRPVRVGLVGLIIVVAGSIIFGGNPLKLLGLLGDPPVLDREPSDQKPSDDDSAELVSVVLADMEDVWLQLFSREGGRYVPATVVLYSNATNSACGLGTSESGPFYCQADQRVYIDLDFMGELQRMGASGDFALAYILGHEIGHHVQQLMGTTNSARERERSSGLRQTNRFSIALELQADCYAGVWAHHSHRSGNIRYDADDFAEGLKTAAVIGDDHLQREAGQRVRHETFTHGTSAERAEWLTRGFRSGRIQACATL